MFLGAYKSYLRAGGEHGPHDGHGAFWWDGTGGLPGARPGV